MRAVPLPLLAQPHRYRACTTDLLVDEAARAYWLDLFESHFPTVMSCAIESGAPDRALRAAQAELGRQIAILRAAPDHLGRLDILTLDEQRDRILRDHGIEDAFLSVKGRENERALSLLPAWHEQVLGVERTHGIGAAAEQVVRAMLAGNLFDMGAHATASEYTASGGATRSQERDQWLSRVPPRPWFRDDVEPFASHVSLQPPSHTVIFADNAGADVLLGVLPLAMLLARAGGHVTIGANARPSLNDITAPELAALIDEIRRRRVIEAPELSRVSVASTGSGAPLIDLLRVDPAFAQTSSTAQLVVLVGMGRALESNWNAAFRVNVLRVAMIKDQQVARGLGARLFDAVVRWG